MARAGRQVSVLFQRYLERLIADADRAAGVWSETAGGTAREMILRRTQKGVDRFGRRFRAYRPSTKRKRRRKGLRIGLPNLRFRSSGSMLDGMGVRSGLVFGSVELYFTDRRAERIARFHIGGTSRMAARDFFGLNTAEVQILADAFRNEVQRRIPEDRRRRVTLVLLRF